MGIGDIRFPPVICGGLIEASESNPIPRIPGTFPPVICGGLIEAIGEVGANGTNVAVPPRDLRGPH